MKRFFLTLLVLIASVQGYIVVGQIIFSDDFENGIGKGWQKEACGGDFIAGCDCGEGNSILTENGVYGNTGHSFKTVFKRCHERAEIAGEKMRPGGEYWYGWSMFITEEWDSYCNNGWGTSITQWHRYDGKMPSWLKGGLPTSIYVTPTGEIKLRILHEDSDKPKTKATKTFELGRLKDIQGKWVNFVVHAKWSSGTDGFFQLWIDDEQRVDYKGSAWFYDPAITWGPYHKLGQYRGAEGWEGKEPLVIYYDYYKLADKKANYDFVAPPLMKNNSMTKPESKIGKLLFHDEFNEFHETIWNTDIQDNIGKVAISDGVMDIVSGEKKGISVWFTKNLIGDYKIEFMARCEGDSIPNDLNLFCQATVGESGYKFPWDAPGLFSGYDKMKLYYFGIGGHDNKTTRFRKYFGNDEGEKPVIIEFTDSSHLLVNEKWYKIQILKAGLWITILVDDNVWIEYRDNNPHPYGYFGFRTYDNHLQINDFKVFELKVNKNNN